MITSFPFCRTERTNRAGNHFDSGSVATFGLDLISWLLSIAISVAFLFAYGLCESGGVKIG
jgi:hypothetical protein